MSWFSKDRVTVYCCDAAAPALGRMLDEPHNCPRSFLEAARLAGWDFLRSPGETQITCPACDEKNRVYATAVERLIEERFDALVRAKMDELRK